MLQFKVKELILAKGQRYPAKFLATECGLSHNKAQNLASGKQRIISLDDFGLICKRLGCLPNELMYWKQTPGDLLPADHPLITQLAPPNGDEDWSDLLSDLSPEDVEELRRLAREKKKNKGK